MGKFTSIVGLLLLVIAPFSFGQTSSWLGKWTGEHQEGVTYTLIVKDQYKGMNQCVVHAEGIQTFYTLACQATGSSTLLNVYFRSATDGAFYAKDRVKLNQPLFVLKREKGKVIWQWQQIFDDKLVMQKGS